MLSCNIPVFISYKGSFIVYCMAGTKHGQFCHKMHLPRLSSFGLMVLCSCSCGLALALRISGYKIWDLKTTRVRPQYQHHETLIPYHKTETKRLSNHETLRPQGWDHKTMNWNSEPTSYLILTHLLQTFFHDMQHSIEMCPRTHIAVYITMRNVTILLKMVINATNLICHHHTVFWPPTIAIEVTDMWLIYYISSTGLLAATLGATLKCAVRTLMCSMRTFLTHHVRALTGSMRALTDTMMTRMSATRGLTDHVRAMAGAIRA